MILNDIRFSWFLVFFLVFFLQSASADSKVIDSLHRDTLLKLSRQAMWMQLLHYDNETNGSEIKSTSFFLSDYGAKDPMQELQATIQQYDEPWRSDANQHARCRFPARYYWLNQHINLPDFNQWKTRCKRFLKWSKFESLRSISLLLVSGYFGNPASAFGHSLLKLNTAETDDPQELFDLSINFGALVPENEGTIPYVIRGLFGGYDAGYSDRYYYTQDLVYSRREFRDIWSYELNLTRPQRELLVMHLWEIVAKKYDYYFLTENCAFRLAKLLELVTGETFTANTRLWYLPVETFHSLVDIDQLWREQGRSQLIRKVHYHPSSQRAMHQEFDQLEKNEVGVAKRVISKMGKVDDSGLSNLPPERQSRILEALLSYYNFQIISEQPEENPETMSAKKQVLIERLNLPANLHPKPEIPELSSPVNDSRPLVLGMGIGQDLDRNNYTILHWTPYSKEWLAINNGEGDEFVLLDLGLALPGNGEIFVEKIDILRIRKLNLAKDDFSTESKWSWELQITGRHLGNLEDKDSSFFIRAGLGKAWAMNNNWALFSMTAIEFDNKKPRFNANPYIGIYRRTGSFRMQLLTGYRWEEDKSEWNESTQIKLQYNISPQNSVSFKVDSDSLQRAAIIVDWRW
jgi:hypothetical protein